MGWVPEAPIAMALSGLTPLLGLWPKMFFTTWGIHVILPTKITLSISLALMPVSLSAFLQGSTVCWMRGATRVSNCNCMSLVLICWGPDVLAVMKGNVPGYFEFWSGVIKIDIDILILVKCIDTPPLGSLTQERCKCRCVFVMSQSPQKICAGNDLGILHPPPLQVQINPRTPL